MPRWLIIALVLLMSWGAMNSWRHREVKQPPGILAPNEPLQENLGADVPKIRIGDVMLTPRAHYVVTARVLSLEHYYLEKDSKVVPDDLGISWGRMSDSAVLASFKIYPSYRFLMFELLTNTSPIPADEVERSLANNHMIPANAGVKRELEKIRIGQVVHFEGFLVDARSVDFASEGGWFRNTSMTRTDVGNGACEQVYLESIHVVTP